MDAKKEDVDNDDDDDKPVRIPTWAEQSMSKILQSNAALAKSNRKLAAEARGLKEERRKKRKADPHSSLADLTLPFVDDQMHSTPTKVQNQHTQTGTGTGLGTPTDLVPKPINAVGPLQRSSLDLQIRPISSSGSGDSTP
ncbi:hypothetical protein LWI28_004173 [Acer negundo]|uniref:Uncharacterized protein n=1 Tax=Acer negundo TaxID=4023 RepID=A0AAD5IQR0_ACENE|nr:hypothetical protein LWI28_004173 [Acer negundo]